MSLRRKVAIALAAIAAVVAGYWFFKFEPDTTPEGAYMRIASAISRDRPVDAFAYLEEDAQQASFTIGSYAKLAVARIDESYPAEQRARARAPYAPLAVEGPEAFTVLARQRGWIDQLRRDLSQAEAVQVDGDRATITTTRGTRYSFRRRPNGIWGLTLFTAELDAEAMKMARDWDLIQRAAADYEREQHGEVSP